MSSKSYYEILEIEPNSNNEEIAKAYRRLSYKYHPKRNSPKDFAVNNFEFHKIAEAFSVLSNSSTRGVYDTYGKDGLKNGIKDKIGNLKGGFHYSGNAFELFEKFCGTFNPFTLIKDGQFLSDEYSSMFGNGLGGFNEKLNDNNVKNEILEFYLDLEDAYLGGVKTFSYNRNVLNEDHISVISKSTEISVEIPQGFIEGTILTFPGMGNQFPGKKTFDLKVKLLTKKHNIFTRNNSDLIITYQLNLAEALKSETLKVSTLDDRILYIAMDEIISPQTVKKIEGEGLVKIDETKKRFFNLSRDKAPRGDLYIKFDIRFPKNLRIEDKDELIRLLSEQN